MYPQGRLQNRMICKISALGIVAALFAPLTGLAVFLEFNMDAGAPDAPERGASLISESADRIDTDDVLNFDYATLQIHFLRAV